MDGTVLDVFNTDPFSFISLTDSINKMPYIPGRAGTVANWIERGITTLTLMIEERNGVLELINPSERGSAGDAFAKRQRKVRVLRVPHYQIDDGVWADEVQEFGSENQVMALQTLVSERAQEHVTSRLDPTLEYQRLGALQGIILNADGSVLYNLFDEFGVTQPITVSFELDSTAANGSVRAACNQMVREIGNSMGGLPFAGVHALVGADFYEALIKNAEVRATYLNQMEAAQLRNGTVYQPFNYGGITFEEYRGATGIDDEDQTIVKPMVEPTEAHFFPVNVPGLYRTVNAPADYIDTVNTIGLPRYNRLWRMDNDKGMKMEIQSNSLSFVTRPRVLRKATLT
jgi:hypothetical protein